MALRPAFFHSCKMRYENLCSFCKCSKALRAFLFNIVAYAHSTFEYTNTRARVRYEKRANERARDKTFYEFCMNECDERELKQYFLEYSNGAWSKDSYTRTHVIGPICMRHCWLIPTYSAHRNDGGMNTT